MSRSYNTRKYDSPEKRMRKLRERIARQSKRSPHAMLLRAELRFLSRGAER
jgi:hypothetical protein